MRFRIVEEMILETLEDAKKYYPNISEEDFYRIIALDPTFTKEKDKLGTYGKWILALFQKGKLTNEGHIRDILTRFETEKNNLVNKDIMRYKSIEELDDMLNDEDSYKVKTHRQELRQTQKAVRNTDINKEADLVYEDSNWEVWIPKTYEASCKLGQGSTWCTASTSSDYYYNYYKGSYGGEYYIVINKHNPEEKYQFHFESRQFMDADDKEIKLEEFMNKNAGLREFFLLICKNVLDKEISQDIVLDVDRLCDDLKNGDMSDDFLQACFADDIWGQFEYYGDLDTRGNAEYGIENELDEETRQFILGKGYSLTDDEVLDVAAFAYEDAERVGAIDECMEDFYRAIRDGIKNVREEIRDLTFTREESFGNAEHPEYGTGNIIIHFNTEDTLSPFILIQAGEDWEDNVYNVFEEGFKFREPYYGWQGFNKVTFNDYIKENL